MFVRKTSKSFQGLRGAMPNACTKTKSAFIKTTRSLSFMRRLIDHATSYREDRLLPFHHQGRGRHCRPDLSIHPGLASLPDRFLSLSRVRCHCQSKRHGLSGRRSKASHVRQIQRLYIWDMLSPWWANLTEDSFQGREASRARYTRGGLRPLKSRLGHHREDRFGLPWEEKVEKRAWNRNH